MNSANRIFVNTLAQYLRAVLNIVLSFFSTRLILDALGISDYGIFSLIAGIISMLSFITNALVISTQRFMSYYQGKNNLHEIKKVFCSSILLHLFLGLIILFILEIASIFIFNLGVNIPQERIYAAKSIYHLVAILIFFNFIGSPFRALIISHENIVYISILDVFDGLLKVIFAIMLNYSSFDRLILHGIFITSISLINIFGLVIFCFIKYEECIIPRKAMLSRQFVVELMNFAGWTIYNVAGVVVRTQGIAVLLNRFFGTIINASYGIAIQISGSISFLSLSLLNAINPQIMKSEGEGDRDKTIYLSLIASKFSFFLISFFAIPCIFEMPVLLDLWLKDVPDFAIFFCQMVLIAAVFDQLTLGLGSSIQATGNIKHYSLGINTLKMITLPVAYLLLRFGFDIKSTMFTYIFFELICALARIYFAKKVVGLNSETFFTRVLRREFLPISILIISCIFITGMFSFPFRFVATFIIPNILFFISIIYWGLTFDEKRFFIGILRKVKSRIR